MTVPMRYRLQSIPPHQKTNKQFLRHHSSLHLKISLLTSSHLASCWIGVTYTDYAHEYSLLLSDTQLLALKTFPVLHYVHYLIDPNRCGERGKGRER